jgi:hypothetical protein
VASRDNLKPFSSENQPKNRRSRKGVLNRSTVLKKWLYAEAQILNPGTFQKEKGTAEDEIILALLRRAKAGNVQAIKEVLDTVYGKQSNTNLNFTPEELQKLTDEELDALSAKFSR